MIPELIFRWLHIIPAMIMAGGILFMRFCLAGGPDDSPSLLSTNDAIRKRWARLVMISTMLLLVSGLYNAWAKAVGYELSLTYNLLLGIKMLLAFAIFFFAALLSGRSERAVQFREQEKKWLNVLVAMVVALVLIAGYLNVISLDFSPK